MRQLMTLTLLLSLVLAACANRGLSQTVQVPAWSGELPISDPWLRDQLPSGTITYQRIPHPLGLLALPKDNLFDTALGSSANIRNLLGIQQGLAENLADDSPLFADPRIRLLIDQLRSPIEVAAMGLPVPSVLIGLTLDLRSQSEFEALLAELAAYPPFPGLVSGTLDDAGFGQFQLPQPVYVHFDADSGRLALYGGLGATRAAFETMLEPVTATSPHPMFALEAQIDTSGQGLFGWIDTTQALVLGALFLPPDAQQMLRVSGADQMRALAYGTGVANGNGRLKIMADLGTDRARRPLPVVANNITATAVGEPRSLMMFSIPEPAEFARLETLILAYLPPEAASQWAGAKAALAESSGVSIEDLLAAVGPELIAYSDQAGDYFALKVRDSGRLDAVLNRLAASSGIALDERRVEGQEIRHVSLAGGPGVPSAVLAGEIPALLGIVGRMRNRIFWVEDGAYLYLAGMPQPLMDRARMGADRRISDWLSESQRVDFSTSLFAATGSVANLPRRMYEFYVGAMQGIADMVEVDYDIWAMPSASQLGLPDRGTLAFSMNLGEPMVSLELSYASHPAAILLGGSGMATAAALGIAAAIALPALQEYGERARMAETARLAVTSEPAPIPVQR